MKTIKLFITLCLMACLVKLNASPLAAIDNKPGKYIQVTIQTSGTCQSCKDKIENNIAYEKGVKDVVFCLATGEVTIVYNPKKNTVPALCTAIQKLGFTAQECVPSHSCAGNCTSACAHSHNGQEHCKPANK